MADVVGPTESVAGTATLVASMAPNPLSRKVNKILNGGESNTKGLIGPSDEVVEALRG